MKQANFCLLYSGRILGFLTVQADICPL